MKKPLTALMLLAAGAILFLLTATILIPSDMIMDFVKERLKTGPGLILTEEASERVLPFGIRANGLLLSKGEGGSLLYLDTITVSFAPLGLLTGGLMARIDATIARGRVEGTILLKTNRTEIDLNISGVGFGAIPAIVNAGLKGSGSLNGRALLTLPPDSCPEATINLKGAGLDGDDLNFKGFSLPFGRITDSGLKARVLDCQAKIDTLWIDGSGMSARIGGLISLAEPMRQSVVDLDIEIVQRGPATEDALLPLLLKRYRKSANSYSIKVGGTLGSPIVRP
jgi:type II secretion system protein N